MLEQLFSYLPLTHDFTDQLQNVGEYWITSHISEADLKNTLSSVNGGCSEHT